MQIKLMPLKALRPYRKNPRKISQNAIDAVANSITNHGFNQPIVVNQNNVICVGHARFKAAQKLKLKEVPVFKKKMTAAQFKAYNLADNKSQEFAEWDFPAVGELLKDLEKAEYDLNETLFNNKEIEHLLYGAQEDIDVESGHNESEKESKKDSNSITFHFESKENHALFLDLLNKAIEHTKQDSAAAALIQILQDL